LDKTESHPARNTVIGTVVGGILLSFWAPFRDILIAGASWLWATLKSVGVWLASAQSIYGWVLIILVFLSLPTCFKLLSIPFRNKEPDFEDLYRSDHLFGADWHWSYRNGDINNLWCLCPTCKSELVYSEIQPDPYSFNHNRKEPRVDFICERCDLTRCTLNGSRSYALERIKREIRRKIRSGEWRPESLVNDNCHASR